jgi:hypothetical protein
MKHATATFRREQLLVIPIRDTTAINNVKPKKPVPGSSTPADNSGEAHPIIPSGGIAVNKRPATIAPGKYVRLVENVRAHGRASRELQRRLRASPSKMCAFSPKK